MRLLPGLAIVAPSDPWETARAVEAAAEHEGPVFLRISRFPVPKLPRAENARFAIGQAETLREGRDVAIIACGVMVSRALEAAEALASAGVQARVVNMASIAPLDEDAIRAAADLGAIVTVEEHSVRGGLGGAVAEVTVTYRPCPNSHSGLPGPHADRISEVPIRKVRLDSRRHRKGGARGDLRAQELMTGFVLAIDQGTTNTKALALDPKGRIVARHSVPTPISYPRLGWVEQSGDDVWRAAAAAVNGCLTSLPEEARVASIGISNQRETVLLWRRSTGETIGPCVTWQCRRSADRIDALRTQAIEEVVEATTGLGLDPLFPAAKISWLLNAYPETRSLVDHGDLCVGTIDSWLLFKLTGGKVHATDASNASRTQLFDIHQQIWSDELCGLFDLPKSILPSVEDSDASFGAVKNVDRSIEGVPVRAMMGRLSRSSLRTWHPISWSCEGDLRHRLVAHDLDRKTGSISIRSFDDCRLATRHKGSLCSRGKHLGIRSGRRMDG